ncbi:VWA domain-containing protein [Sedimentitalea sp. JM2-8]|uniref:VWA domain-containing protein n=1 Tax=Sedimentitalea xiamensis TaxID=3050037 RepID=A0ABT7FKH5_9RHOB|nr:vWA domain-containing protein [Sedimentitalea xiamensis]MDK3075649.1 VWA domain-containing protein [Sedimentitalea xiamensis]
MEWTPKLCQQSASVVTGHEALRPSFAVPLFAAILTFVLGGLPNIGFAEEKVAQDGACPLNVDNGLVRLGLADIFKELERTRNGFPASADFDNGLFGKPYFSARSDTTWLTAPIGSGGFPFEDAPEEFRASDYDGTAIGSELQILKQAPSGEYLVIYASDPDRTGQPYGCAWVERDNVVPGDALTFDDLSASRNLSELYVPEDSLLTAKVVARNDPTDAGQGAVDSGAKLYGAPDGPPMGKALKLFDINYVFDFEDSGETTYLLIGGHQKEGTAVLGWVDVREVILWSTRMSGYFPANDAPWKPTGSTPANRKEWFAFANQFDAEDFARAAGTPEPLAVKPDDLTEPDDKVRPRFPIIDHAQVDALNYYAIAFPGASDNPGTASREVSIETLDARGEYLRDLEAARSVDVALLIDGTYSMGKYFELAADAVNKFLLERIDDRELLSRWRIAAYAYGDYDDPSAPESVQFLPLERFGSTGSGAWRRVMDRLANASEPFRSDPNKDKPEAVGAAIQRVLQEDFRSEGELRVVIVIGDHGPCDGTKVYALLGQEPVDCARVFGEPVSIDDVAKDVKAAQASVIFVGVRGEEIASDSKQDVDAIMTSRGSFEGFARALSMETVGGDVDGKLGVGFKRSFDPDQTSETDEAVVDSIYRQIGNVFSSVDLALDARAQSLRSAQGDTSGGPANKPMEKIAPGALLESDRLTILYLTNRFLDILDERGVSKSAANQALATSQFVDVGWVPEQYPDGTDMLDFWVAMDYRALEGTQIATTSLCNAFGPNREQEAVRALYKEMFKTVAGEPPDWDRPIAVLIEEKLQIPANHLSHVLRENSVEDLVIWLNNQNVPPEEKTAFTDDICRSQAWLFNVINGKIGSGLRKVESGGGRIRWELENARPYSWDWGTVGGAALYWLPVEMLP